MGIGGRLVKVSALVDSVRPAGALPYTGPYVGRA
jgi:hypothetical protein